MHSWNLKPSSFQPLHPQSLLPSTFSKTPSFTKSLPLNSATAAPPAPPSHPNAGHHRHFHGRASFPESLSLHSKNPKSIYRDIQRLARQSKLREALTVLDYLDQRGIPVNPTTFSALLSAASQLKSLFYTRQIHARLRISGLHLNEFLLTKLVEAYAACGSPKHAKLVFSELSPSTVYPWNALLRGNLTGGSRWGYEPLSIFLAMREAGVEVNEYTFSSLLKSFAGSPALSEGMKAHALLIKNEFAGAPLLIKTGLVDMYFKCRKVGMAMKIFDEIPEKDIVSWGTVIAGFAHNKLRWEALECLRRMVGEEIEPNSVVITSVLPVVGELSKRNLGREVHCYVMKRFRNFVKMIFILSGLIDMYCKCKDITSARRVFYASSERNEVCWTALMSGYASNNRLEQALRTIAWMQLDGIKPDVVSIATVLPVCVKLKAWRQGQEIHGYSLKHWFLPNVSVETSLITMYSQCGKIASCCRVFDGMKGKNVIAWTALIESYLRSSSPTCAFKAFRSMVTANQRPDAVILCRTLRACGKLRALKLGKEIHAQVYKLNLEMIPSVVGEIVSLYGKCREIKMAQKEFDQVQAKGSLTWTAAIEAYSHNKMYREALKMFDLMLSDGYNPTHFTFDVVFYVCDEAGLANEALKFFEAMIQKYKLNATKENFDCMISLLSRVGRIDEAQHFTLLRSRLV
ncbi:LOW QUALITY PROTEIN: pentatricopeptide repeat-containing protein At1g71460, chloroplastic [Phalaenopsis equestris]|uniref:LOW QUALITY PROTEIN: pentatricopeptide repeat-containing protein At1g71460, chloroplastic n=1 Tax=Phalaenopsis equestris TaxID=78828 RepID=UPI0009E1CCA3|nr:LOW QUALITY PROTEIN: pentatricopeptide repeat-containing protein At1g71460, chloroplastic [Phalaenopsis equestris]